MVAILEVALGSSVGSGSAAAQADQRAEPPVQGVAGVEGVVVPGSAAEAVSVAPTSVPGAVAPGSAGSAVVVAAPVSAALPAA